MLIAACAGHAGVGREALLGRFARTVQIGALALALASCATNAVNMTSASPDKPWVPTGNEGKIWSLQHPAPPRADAGFAIPADPERARMAPTPGVSTTQIYSLPELIDLAQRNNPATRAAWEQARQAALAVGIVEATYLPAISASVIGGAQRLTNPLQVPIGDVDSIETTAKGVTSIIAMQWLLFDFGQRDSLANVAKQEAFAANVLFNGVHQRIIFEVASAYYVYGAAVRGVEIAQLAATNSRDIQAAAEARLARGVGTTIEVAQARQLTAQSRMRLTLAEGQKSDTYHALLAAVGTNAPLKVDGDAIARRKLPAPATMDLDETVKLALSQRADVAASYAQVLAAKSSAHAADRDYLPKFYMGSSVAWGTGGFETAGLPTINQQGSGTGILLGVTVPVFDGGIRRARREAAQARMNMLTAEFERVQSATVTQVVGARNRLQTSLATYEASSALVEAAAVTYDATLTAYRSGVGTVTEASVADNGLLDAQLAQVDAHTASLVGALNLAFVTGALASGNQLPIDSTMSSGKRACAGQNAMVCSDR